ncbi:MAG: ZIP family metal transporter [Muribaculaceae bacterium]|nr:ZIP family metal transporter [Muribaculaceae bacterium]
MDGLILGLTLPFLGTALGAACVLFMKDRMPTLLQKGLTGFAAGVMVAASVWSLLIPSMEMAGEEGFMRVFPDIIGFALGMGFLLLLDVTVPHQHIDEKESEGPKSNISRTKKLVFAVTLHNIPEGMAVGVALAAALEHNAYLPMAGALALSLGIAIQNFPEGAIVSMPIRAIGNSRKKAFGMGVLSGLVEPIAAVVTILLASFVVPILPYLLAFAAGAMMYVVVEELIPETQEGIHSNWGTIGFAFGFILMMVLDVVLG